MYCELCWMNITKKWEAIGSVDAEKFIQWSIPRSTFYGHILVVTLQRVKIAAVRPDQNWQVDLVNRSAFIQANQCCARCLGRERRLRMTLFSLFPCRRRRDCLRPFVPANCGPPFGCSASRRPLSHDLHGHHSGPRSTFQGTRGWAAEGLVVCFSSQRSGTRASQFSFTWLRTTRATRLAAIQMCTFLGGGGDIERSPSHERFSWIVENCLNIHESASCSLRKLAASLLYPVSTRQEGNLLQSVESNMYEMNAILWAL